jgi:PhzF family phenazine biosynthesis protein
MQKPLWIIDAFTDSAFSGNPAAVCLLSEEMPDSWLQSVAAEMNLSETAFLFRQGDRWSLRWLTPTVEVDLCGHATIASAHFLYTQGLAAPGQEIQFSTRSGLLRALSAWTNDDRFIRLDFPAIAATPSETPEGMLEALGVESAQVFRGIHDYLVVLPHEQVVRELNPQFVELAKLNVRGIVVTAPATSTPADFISRGFFPGSGINEDPVTGSAHCMLGPYWGKQLNKEEMLGYQASRRGGFVRVALKNERVYLYGEAVTVVEGVLKV